MLTEGKMLLYTYYCVLSAVLSDPSLCNTTLHTSSLNGSFKTTTSHLYYRLYRNCTEGSCSHVCCSRHLVHARTKALLWPKLELCQTFALWHRQMKQYNLKDKLCYFSLSKTFLNNVRFEACLYSDLVRGLVITVSILYQNVNLITYDLICFSFLEEIDIQLN